MGTSTFYHEDLYKQIEIISEENYLNVYKSISNESADKSISIFEVLKVKGKYNYQLEDLKINVADLTELIKLNVLVSFDQVFTGYSNTQKLKINTIAFGFERIILFIELNNFKIIKNLWICQSIDTEKNNNPINLFKVLINLGNTFNLILVDWNEEKIVDLKDEGKLKNYLEETFCFKLS